MFFFFFKMKEILNERRMDWLAHGLLMMQTMVVQVSGRVGAWVANGKERRT